MPREIKRDKTKFEKLIRSVWFSTKKGKVINTHEEKIVITAINETLRYLEIDDYVNNKASLHIFKIIYLMSYKTATQIKLGRELFMNKNTVGSHCKKFIKIFEKIYSDLKI